MLISLSFAGYLLTFHSISAFWNQVDLGLKFSPGGYDFYCINEGADVVANGIVSTVHDFIVAFLPTLLCWKLQMPIRQKIALYGIFAISYTTVVIGALRTYTSSRIYFQTYDVTWEAGNTFLLSILELHIGTMCANAPALKVFFKHLLQSERLTKLISSRSSKSRSNSSRIQRSNDPTATANTGVSKSSAWIPIAFWKSSHSRSASGYLSESNATVTTDKHGGIVHTDVQNQADYDKRDSDSMSKRFAPAYHDTVVSWQHDHDVEMNPIRPQPRDIRGSDVQALPPLPAPSSLSRWRPMRLMSLFPK